MAPNFTGGVLKRHMPQENIHTKKCKPSSELVYRESSTMYHNLLASLGSANKVVADMNKRRQREEEGKSSDTEEDEDEDEDEDEENSGLSAEDDDDEIHQGADQHSLTSNTEQKNNDNHHNEEKEEDSEDCETDDEEEEHELRSTNGQSSSTSAFSEHLCHKLSSEEVETLSKGNLKFKWEAPAMGMPNYTWKGTRPNFLHVAQSDATYGLKPKLYKHWLQLYEKSGGKDFESSNRRTFFSICNSYLDILHPNKRPFYSRGGGEDSSHMEAYLMHSLNHIFRTRDLVKKNESKIFKHSEEEFLSDDGFLDQGFTRPKVLILLPYRSIAFRVVMRLIQLTPEAQRVNVQHLDRFNNEFGCDDGDVKTSKNEKSKKPSDWQALIGEGNDDDTFMLGIKHTRKSIRLYGDFYSSDIIIASPVGLLVAIGKAEENKELDVDYLSSIEVLVIDHADVMSMQN